jgi:hypothetical protein
MFLQVKFEKGEWDKDAQDIIDLCGSWWEDSLFFKTYNIEYAVDRELFDNLKNANMLVYTIGRSANGKIISCFVGVKSPYMFNKNLTSCSEIVWCIDKEHRNFRNLVGLLGAIEDLMEEEKIMMWNLNVSNEIHYNKTGDFLERRGYTFMDKVYSKQGDNNHG